MVFGDFVELCELCRINEVLRTSLTTGLVLAHGILSRVIRRQRRPPWQVNASRLCFRFPPSLLSFPSSISLMTVILQLVGKDISTATMSEAVTSDHKAFIPPQIISLIAENLRTDKSLGTLATMMVVSKSTYEIAGPVLYQNFRVDDKVQEIFRLLLPSRHKDATEVEKRAIEAGVKERKAYYEQKVSLCDSVFSLSSHDGCEALLLSHRTSTRCCADIQKVDGREIAMCDLPPLLDTSVNSSIDTSDPASPLLLWIRRSSSLLARVTQLHWAAATPLEDELIDVFDMGVDEATSKFPLCPLRPHTSHKADLRILENHEDCTHRVSGIIPSIRDIKAWANPQLLCVNLASYEQDSSLKLAEAQLKYLYWGRSRPQEIRYHEYHLPRPVFQPTHNLRLYPFSFDCFEACDNLFPALRHLAQQPSLHVQVVDLTISRGCECPNENCGGADAKRNYCEREFILRRLRDASDWGSAEKQSDEIRALLATPQGESLKGRLQIGISRDIQCECDLEDDRAEVSLLYLYTTPCSTLTVEMGVYS